MEVAYSPAHARHQPRTFIRRGAVVANPEVAAMARRIADAGLPTVLIQEGGYMSAVLGRNLAEFLAVFAAPA